MVPVAPADLLAGRKTVGRITGDIRFAGHKPSHNFLRRYTGYVEQFGAPSGLCMQLGSPCLPVGAGCRSCGHAEPCTACFLACMQASGTLQSTIYIPKGAFAAHRRGCISTCACA